MQAVSQHSEHGCLHGNSDVHRWNTDFNRKGETIEKSFKVPLRIRDS